MINFKRLVQSVLFAQAKGEGHSVSLFESWQVGSKHAVVLIWQVGSICAVVLVVGEHCVWLRVDLHKRPSKGLAWTAHHPRWNAWHGTLSHPGHVQLLQQSVLVVGAKPLVGSQRVRIVT